MPRRAATGESLSTIGFDRLHVTLISDCAMTLRLNNEQNYKQEKQNTGKETTEMNIAVECNESDYHYRTKGVILKQSRGRLLL